MIVADSSTLIALGKLGRLDLLIKCFDRIIIPKAVYDEVLLKDGSVEAVALKKAVEEKQVIVETVKISPMLASQNIGQGEKEAISVAAKHKALLLVDDETAKAYASAAGVESHGTFFAIYLSCAKKLLNKEDAANLVKAMIQGGFYISTDVYSRFLELLDEIEKK